MKPSRPAMAAKPCGAFLRTLSFGVGRASDSTGRHLGVDGDHGSAKAVRFVLRFALGQLDHERAGTGQLKVGAWKP